MFDLNSHSLAKFRPNLQGWGHLNNTVQRLATEDRSVAPAIQNICKKGNNIMKQSISNIFPTLVLSTLCAGTVAAEPISMGNQSDSDWRYSIATYAFIPARTIGDSTVGGTTIPIDLKPKDAVEYLSFAFAGRFEAWRGSFGLIVDANYVALEGDDTLPAPPGGTVNVDIKQRWLNLMAAYKVAGGTYGKNNLPYAIDLHAGVRYNALKQEVKITLPGPTALPTLGGDEDWFEPVIGARGMWMLNDKWTAITSLELGGFGAGGNDLQIAANVGFEWQAWDKTSVSFGYRYFSMDYSTTLPTGTFAYDVEQHGPVIGLTYKF